MIVVVHHFLEWRWKETVQVKLAAFIFNGNEAVSFFFVLSGFVLSYSYINSSRKIAFGRYLYKRILRLYPAYILTVLLLLFYDIRNNFTVDTFIGIVFRGERSRLLKELLMFQDTHDLYIPGWSLQVEIIYSLIIIGLILLYRKHRYLLLIPLLGSYVIGSPDLRLYMNHFILGIGLSILYPRLTSTPFNESKLYPWRWAVFLLIFILFSFNRLAPFCQPIEDLFHFFWPLHIRWAHFSSVAAFLTIAIVMMSKNAQALLENKVLLYLGKISYSIYLFHWLFVVIIMNDWDRWGAYLGEGAVRVCTMFVLYIGITILAADLMYRLVEEPFIKLSKRKLKQ